MSRLSSVAGGSEPRTAPPASPVRNQPRPVDKAIQSNGYVLGGVSSAISQEYAAIEQSDPPMSYDSCNILYSNGFKECLGNYEVPLRRCEHYLDLLSACRRRASA